MPRCPLCDTVLVGANCPRCSKLQKPPGEDDTLQVSALLEKRKARASGRAAAAAPAQPPKRAAAATADALPSVVVAPEPTTDKEESPVQAATPADKERWYALAGIQRPPDAPSRHGTASEPLPALSGPMDEYKGLMGAGAIFMAQGLASIVIAALGAPSEAASGVISIIFGAKVAMGGPQTRGVLIVGACINLGFKLLALLLTNSPLAVIGMLPAFCILATLFLDTPKQRAAAAGVGVALALSGAVAFAFRPDPKKVDVLADYRIEAWSDAASGASMPKLNEARYYDAQKIFEEIRTAKAGLLGMGLKGVVARVAGGERLLVRGEDDLILALLRVGNLPKHVELESALTPIVGGHERLQRRADLVPLSLRDAPGLEVQGWADDTRSVLLARRPDGQTVTLVCDARRPAGDRVCKLVLQALKVEPRK